MPALSRADNSLLGRWWWSVDRWTLLAIAALIGFGYVLMLAASPAVAERIHQARDALILKQVLFLTVAGIMVVAISLLPPSDIRRIAIIGCAVALLLTAMTLFAGVSIKGARRWIALPGLSLQPSEFLKPCFAVTAAWLIAEGRRSARFPGMLIACALFGVILMLLQAQPDIGMTIVVCAVFFAQLFIGGLNLYLAAILGGFFSGAAGAAYFLFPHVQARVEKFLHPTKGDNFQVDTALQAFGNGGLLGRGPGEGRIKDILPDAHADFVFAVAGEEFGLVVCTVILGLFAFIVIRGLLRLLQENDQFSILAAGGLVTSFGLQAFVNMASSLRMIPTKGMTLPFVSYGGSSVFAVALGMGMLLALTRKRYHGDRAMRGPRVRPIVIAAGGTGGHFFPAEALALELVQRGRRVVLMTDVRSGALNSPVFHDREQFVLSGAGIAGRGVLRGARAVAALAAGVLQARRHLAQLDAAMVVGFGGYPSLPPVLGSRLLRRRPLVVLHEQNAVLGRANRGLARHADLLALSFGHTSKIPPGTATQLTGNPVRGDLAALHGLPYVPPDADGKLRLLVLGGSLGARVLSDVVPAALAGLPGPLRARLTVVQQCRAEDLDRVGGAYAAAGIAAELASFFDDVAARLAEAHLVIARAGASTIAELTVAGRPAILVPLPGAIDDHQTANAAALAEAGGAWLMAQPAFTAAALAVRLGVMLEPGVLANAAARSATLGRPQAAARLADLVEARIDQARVKGPSL